VDALTQTNADPKNSFYLFFIQDYLAFNGLKSGICGKVVSARDIILPADGPQVQNTVQNPQTKSDCKEQRHLESSAKKIHS
jgi:hypothetical protein